MLSASLEKTNDNFESSKDYYKGKLIDDKKDEPGPEARLLDFTKRLGLEAELTQKHILDDVLIDPFKD